MIYTVGRFSTYDFGLRSKARKGERLYKIGRDAEYDGGSVWKTEAEARAHCRVGQAVYGVEADWEKDTAPSRGGGDWHDLLVNRPLVRLSTPKGEQCLRCGRFFWARTERIAQANCRMHKCPAV